MPNKSYRQKYEFWLDLLRDDHREIADIIKQFKNEYKFAPALRTGLSVMWAYDNADYDTLYNLLPDIGNSSALMSALVDERKRIQQERSAIRAERQALDEQRERYFDAIGKLDEIKQLIKQQQNSQNVPVASDNSSAGDSGKGNAKQLNVPSFSAPVFDDDEDDDLDLGLSVRKDTSASNANSNFLASLAALMDD